MIKKIIILFLFVWLLILGQSLVEAMALPLNLLLIILLVFILRKSPLVWWLAVFSGGGADLVYFSAGWHLAVLALLAWLLSWLVSGLSLQNFASRLLLAMSGVIFSLILAYLLVFVFRLLSVDLAGFWLSFSWLEALTYFIVNSSAVLVILYLWRPRHQLI